MNTVTDSKLYTLHPEKPAVQADISLVNYILDLKTTTLQTTTSVILRALHFRRAIVYATAYAAHLTIHSRTQNVQSILLASRSSEFLGQLMCEILHLLHVVIFFARCHLYIALDLLYPVVGLLHILMHRLYCLLHCMTCIALLVQTSSSTTYCIALPIHTVEHAVIFSRIALYCIVILLHV